VGVKKDFCWAGSELFAFWVWHCLAWLLGLCDWAVGGSAGREISKEEGIESL